MTSRELVIKTLNHEAVSRVARDLWLPADEAAIPADELTEIGVRYPSDILSPDSASFHGKRLQPKPGKPNELLDAWGCVWHQAAHGAPIELKHSPLADAGRIASYEPPAAVLDRARFTRASKFAAMTSRFVVAWSDVCPFDRLRLLRGAEAATVDLARGTKDIRGLLARLHDVACKELEIWGTTEVDGVAFRDDWGTPEGLLVSPEMWRDIFRPMYKEYCSILHAHDKFVFFHSAGDISDIFGDLVKLEIDAIHSQLRLMNVERLAKRYRGRVTFWGEIECQDPGNPDAVNEFLGSATAVRKALGGGQGGVITQCPWTPGLRVQTLAAFFEQWLLPLPMHG
jgi:uroporphyrinogen decarboxylase